MAEHLRVCRVINAMWMGGVQRRLLELLPKLQEMGCRAHVLCLRSKGELYFELEKLGIPVEYIHVEGRLHPTHLWRISKFMRRHAFHVVHTHMYQANVTGVVAAKLAGVPCIVSQIHNVNMYKDKRQARTDRLLMPLRDRTLCVSEAVRENTASHMGIAPSRLDVLVNGINLEPRNSPDARERILKELALPADAILIAHVARLHPQKGHKAFLSEFPQVLAHAPNAHLLLAGSGEMQPKLEKLARESGIEEHVHFLGSRNDVPNILSAADISILPSEKEGFSNVVLESMLYGAALVVTDVGGAREQIDDGVDGIIVKPSDAAGFRDAVIALATDANRREAIRRAAKEKVRRFGIEAMAARTIALYTEILRAKGKALDLPLARQTDWGS